MATMPCIVAYNTCNHPHCVNTMGPSAIHCLHLMAYAISIVRAGSGVFPHSHSPIPSSSLLPKTDITSDGDGEVFPNKPSIPISCHILPCLSLANDLVMMSA